MRHLLESREHARLKACPMGWAYCRHCSDLTEISVAFDVETYPPWTHHLCYCATCFWEVSADRWLNKIGILNPCGVLSPGHYARPSRPQVMWPSDPEDDLFIHRDDLEAGEGTREYIVCACNLWFDCQAQMVVHLRT